MFKHIDMGTKIRTAALMIALINQILAVFGVSPIPLDEAMINEVVVQLDLLLSTVLTVGTGIWAWWRDNDVTKVTVDKKKNAGLK